MNQDSFNVNREFVQTTKSCGQTIVIWSPGSRSVRRRFGKVYVATVSLPPREFVTVFPEYEVPRTTAVRHSVQTRGFVAQWTFVNVSTNMNGVDIRRSESVVGF